ncbi:hypothetical protein [Desulfonatronum thioautotrophicum]|uniref:hypothetical protein n=1 Tax=Desulfonatronum thioautotrophicum TaxID=617001 RepID=UPI0005EB7B72|nr:hypothetical protein [Desulfonatronum thioautotrophicum]
MPNKSQHHERDEYFRKIAETRERELELVREHLGLFIENTELILSRPEYFNITTDAAYLGLMVGFYWRIPLGVLVMLWKEGKLMTTCPQCQGKTYVLSVNGSSGSGVNMFAGICEKSASIIRGSLASFPEFWHVLLRMREKYPPRKPQPSVRTKRFSWGEGIVDEPAFHADKHNEPEFIPLDLQDVIPILLSR